jgi:hypothetical protein
MITTVYEVLVAKQWQLSCVTTWYAALHHEISYAVFDQQQREV